MADRDAAAPTVASRLFRILEAFSPERPSLTLSAISRHSGLALTTTHRLVGELAGWGALERAADGSYRIGLRIYELAGLTPRGTLLREVAMPFLGDLYEATRQNVQLGVRDGDEVVYVERISGREAVPVVSRPGGRLPLHATGVGLVLLAHADPGRQEAVLSAPLKRFTERTIADARQLRRTLADVRRQGFAISDRQIELSTLSVAAPVHDDTDEVIAALSIVVPADRTDPMALVPAVRAAARGLSRALGSPKARALPPTAHLERS
ncbi:transcriptional regulator, IclR family [Saccharopolyspora kobensis]|uniref:Transcriptional regulator, IclR family n=1 Tax=Saccharopolyspora kobensis TaxID=146035 RepID=A0A1H5X845_9PSEU|nr:IclR family transcriptional regulator [Saccharopolyspora kobensis]SEG07600.1 transcriptional regulator, IclR family [Saccharopolyspora kobensis]SFE46571.1 transcriptional regulator, IclR family [Saccharopolyspora kobensis]